jgi:hypothetical protein
MMCLVPCSRYFRVKFTLYVSWHMVCLVKEGENGMSGRVPLSDFLTATMFTSDKPGASQDSITKRSHCHEHKSVREPARHLNFRL